jgi:hypothetical protein
VSVALCDRGGVQRECGGEAAGSVVCVVCRR